MNEFTEKYLKENILPKLIAGAQIKLGPKYCKGRGFKAGEVITLIEGSFDHENGLYTESVSCPAIWCEDQKEFDSIYHLFGNNLEDWADCEIKGKAEL